MPHANAAPPRRAILGTLLAAPLVGRAAAQTASPFASLTEPSVPLPPQAAQQRCILSHAPMGGAGPRGPTCRCRAARCAGPRLGPARCI